jgi:hypothetical protein
VPEGAHIGPPRVAEGCNEQVDAAVLALDRHPKLAESTCSW